MPNFIYTLSDPKGLAVAVGESAAMDFLFLTRPEDRLNLVERLPIGRLPERAALDYFLNQLEAEGVSGFFNVVAMSLMDTSHNVAVVHPAQVKLAQNLYSWQAPLGYSGFFRSENLSGVPKDLGSRLADFLVKYQ